MDARRSATSNQSQGFFSASRGLDSAHSAMSGGRFQTPRITADTLTPQERLLHTDHMGNKSARGRHVDDHD